MKLMETFTQKWAIIIPLKHYPDGAEFHFSEFPLHVTLAGVFATSLNGDELGEFLSDFVADVAPFELIGDEPAWFGPNQDVAVTTVLKTPELMQLYEALHRQLIAHGAVFNTPHYEGGGFLPHSSYQTTGQLQPGQKMPATAITLIDLFPNGDGYMRRFTKTFRFPAH